MRIGILEDNQAISATFSEILEYRGHTSSVYRDGWDLLSQIIDEDQQPRTDIFDAVFIDLALPSISGVQVIEAMTDIYPTLPIVVISAFSHEYLENLKRRYPDIEVLQKPFNLHDLFTLLQKISNRTIHITPPPTSIRIANE